MPDQAERCKVHYRNMTNLQVDERRLLIRITIVGKKDFRLYFLAPSRDIFDLVVPKFEAAIVTTKVEETTSITESCVVPPLIEPPPNASIALFLFLFPLRYMLHWTLPDVRVLRDDGSPTNKVAVAVRCILSCLLWLVVSSYAMVMSLEQLADRMHIPESVIGVTVSAAGTSLPNYVASRIAAKNGFGVRCMVIVMVACLTYC